MKSQTSVIIYRGAPIPFEYTFIGTKQYVFEVTLEESGQILPVLRGMYEFPYTVDALDGNLTTIIGRKQFPYTVGADGYRTATVLGKKQFSYPIGVDFYRSPTVLGKTVAPYTVDAGLAPIPPKPVEQYFNYNSLLLTGTGPDNGTNNSIVDSSPFNLTLFKYGSTTQGSFSPYSTISGYWSVYFGNTGSGYLSVPGTATSLGTDDFTVEAWIYCSVLNTSVDTIISNYSSGTVGLRILVNVGTVGGIRVLCGNTQVLERAGAITSSNNWVHVAVVRSSGTTVLYVGGTAVANNIDNNNYGVDREITTIGAEIVGSNPTQYFPGYISNLRVVRGTAVYNGNFTPQDIPLRAIDGTRLLVCQDSRYRDRSSNLHPVTAYGSAAVSAVSPYLPSVTYNVTKFGGSLSFLGEYNFLYNFNTNSANVLSGNFTIEGWFYFTAGDLVETQAIYTNYEDPFGEGTIFFGKSEDVGGCVSFWAGDYNLYEPLLTDIELPPNACWIHYAVVKNGPNCTLYKNGIAIDTATYADGLSNTPGPMFIATHGIAPGFYLYKGYITDFRIVNGTAVYTSDFIPPSGPLQPITNTSLLLGGRAAAVYDSGVKTDVTTDGVIIAGGKWGTGGMLFNGQSTISVESSDLFNLSGGTWTVEGWFWLDPAPTNDCPVVMIGAGGNNNSYAALVIKPNLSLESKVPVVGATAVTTVSNVIATRVYNHIAVVMRNNLGSIYVNGILRAGPISNVTQMNNISNTLTIGADPTAQFGSYFSGYINDLRITKGIARYNGNFTPPGPL